MIQVTDGAMNEMKRLVAMKQNEATQIFVRLYIHIG